MFNRISNIENLTLIEVDQKGLDSEYFRIDLAIGNICNYKCWYCFPGSNEGTVKWPDFELLKSNLSHLLDCYVAYGKKKIQLNLLGGEVTHWSRFIDFVSYFKSNYDCVISLTTNGSKKIDWWEKAVPYLGSVGISHHQEYTDIEHVRNLADFLYTKNVVMSVAVLMDPTRWNACLDSVEYYKKSKYSWSIRYKEVLHSSINYTAEQKKLISKSRARRANIFWFLRNNVKHKNDTVVVDTLNKKYKVYDQTILLNRKNNFKGWECTLGTNWVSIDSLGVVGGMCGNKLYKASETYNIFDIDFREKFNPEITNTTCRQSSCWCSFEVVMPKKQITSSNNKVIPIHNIQ